MEVRSPRVKHRIEVDPFNLVASLIFLCAIIHAFTANKITKFSHFLEVRHQEKLKRLKQKETPSIVAEFTHFFGEVEAVFGIWLVVLLFFFLGFKGWLLALLKLCKSCELHRSCICSSDYGYGSFSSHFITGF